jgi:hypothetical protein
MAPRAEDQQAGSKTCALELDGDNRFKASPLLDLLEAVDEENSDLGDILTFKEDMKMSLARQESSHGPLHWNTRCSTELQRAVDAICIEELMNLEFSVTVADPQQPDCPLIACSLGFTELTGYSVQEIVGRNCRFLLNGVQPNLIDDETRMKCRAFCVASRDGEDYSGAAEQLPPGCRAQWAELPKGEIICVQTNARKSGELFRNMFFLKQIELDENQFILGLQAGLPDDFDECASQAELEARCQSAFRKLEGNMTALEHVLAQQFWYSAPMRRQV